MATEPKHDSTHTELAMLKQHVGVLTQTVMALLSHIAQQGQRPQPPPQAGAPNPALMQRIAQMAAARRAQQMGGAPGMSAQGGPPPMGGAAPPMRPPGMAVGGLQMGMNRLEPMGNFNRGIAHSLTPTHLNFHGPHLHLAMGGMPMAHPGMMMHRPPMMGAGMQRPMMHPGMSSLGMGAPMGGAPLV
jgi:hypothetical protein